MKISTAGVALKSESARNALTLTIGTSIGQIFPVLFYPVLGRIFTPVDFGILATLTSITSILSVLASGNYENSILITLNKKDAINIIGLTLLLSAAFLTISFAVLQIFSDRIIVWFKEPGLKKWLFICPISSFAIIIFNCYNEWCVRNKYFVNLSWNKISNSAAVTLSKVLLGFVKVVSSGLVVGDLIGRVISALSCIFRAYKTDRQEFFQLSFKRMQLLAGKYVEFPKYSLPGQLIDTFNTQLPIFMIASFFMSTELGYYAMAGNVLYLPSRVISTAVKDVFRQKASEEWMNKKNCRRIYNKAVRLMFIIIAPTSILLMIILPDLFALLLGENWRIAGIYARILMPNVAILFMYQVVAAVFIIANKIKASFVWQLFSITLTFISLCVGCLVFKDIKITLISYVLARSVANLTRFYLTFSYSRGFES